MPKYKKYSKTEKVYYFTSMLSNPNSSLKSKKRAAKRLKELGKAQLVEKQKMKLRNDKVFYQNKNMKSMVSKVDRVLSVI